MCMTNKQRVTKLKVKVTASTVSDIWIKKSFVMRFELRILNDI